MSPKKNRERVVSTGRRRKSMKNVFILATLIIVTSVNVAIQIAFLGPFNVDLSSLDVGFDASHEKLNGSSWRVPTLREDGFLFEVQVMNYGPFTTEAVNSSVVKYEMGEVTRHHQGFEIGEWGYSFFHLKDGALDGSGRPHYGGFPSPPRDRREALDVIKNYLLNLSDGETRPWSAFNGHYPFHHYAGELGFDVLGSEIGENINNYQMMLAFNRGAARQFNKPWFVDVSAWYAGTITDYSTTRPWGDAGGAQFGHSLSLYKRAYFTSFLAGAGAVVAEAGGVNFFLEEKDADGCFLPSPLGEVGREFYQFTMEIGDPGIPFTPFGILLDKYHGTYPGFGKKNAFDVFPYNRGDQMTWELLNMFFPGGWEVSGESGTLVNGPLGDTCDVILQDAPAGVLASYPVIITSGDITFSQEEIARLVVYVENGGILVLDSVHARQFPPDFLGGQAPATGYRIQRVGDGAVIIHGKDHDMTGPGKEIIKALHEKLVPFKISGDRVQYLLNRLPDGWLVGIINNDGVTKQPRSPPLFDHAMTRHVAVTYKGDGNVSWVDMVFVGSNVGVLREGKSFQATIPPGEILVVKFHVS